jgi:hypothetical protein
MNRQTVLALAAAAAATGTSGLIASAKTGRFASGGLDLPLSDWENVFGAGKIGQTYRSFMLDDGDFRVGVAGENRAVGYIELNHTDPAEVALAGGQDEAVTLIPADARVQGSFVANDAQIMHGSPIDRYQSKSLAGQFAGDTARAYTERS